MVAARSWQRDFGVDRTSPPGFFSHKDELRGDVPQTHALRQAFDLLDLDGVLCAESAPLVYFKQVDAVRQDDALQLHRRFWNHGGAPILVLIAPNAVHVYSGMIRPEPIGEPSATPSCLIDTLTRVATGLQDFLVSVESGAYFREHAPSFNSENRVDRALLENLRETRDVLREQSHEDVPLDSLDALLCRVVFTCYLFDRHVIGRTYLDDLEIKDCSHLRDILNMQPRDKARRALYQLFRQLGEDFNGDLFNDDLGEELGHIDDRHIQTLCEFLHGTDVRTGQRRFWPYDFGYIPIETISAIYEHFLRDEEIGNGVFYTPRFLAEVVLDTALAGVQTLTGKTYLDPACGSGIFLVGIFNRIATEWARANPKADNDTRATELMLLLRTSVFGVDKSRTACRIAAFSLYLAYLDQLEPRDIQELQRKGDVLPRLVVYGTDHAAPDGSPAEGNIQCADFFSEVLEVATSVDLVIGNPPWGSVASDDTAAGEWCANNEKPIPGNQIAAAFVWKAVNHLNESGSVCFVLPHGILFNHSASAVRFQRAWVSSHGIDRVLNLTDFRFFLFREAVHPAVIVRYRGDRPDVVSGQVEYWTPKVDWMTSSAEIITVDAADRATIRVRDLLDDLGERDAPQVWNRHFWATPRDLRLLDRLSDLPRLRDHVRASLEKDTDKRWVRAEGFQPVSPNDDVAKAKWLELPSEAFINAKSTAIDLFLRPDDCDKLESRRILVRNKSNKNTEIFRAPHVLITQGFRRVAFADFDVSFRHAVRGIHGPVGDRKLLIFLAAYLRTDVARYFLFHTSSNWGVYRPKVHVEEILRLPLPLPDQLDDRERGQQIVDEVARIVDGACAHAGTHILDREGAIDKASSEIERLIEEYFDIHELEKCLIEDTIKVIVPSVHPTENRMPIPTLRISTPEQCAAYTERLCSTLNGWAEASEYGVRGNWIVSEKLGVGSVMLEMCSRSRGSKIVAGIEGGVLEIVQRIREAISDSQGSIRPLRGLGVFDGNSLYMVKSAAHVWWTDTAALNDADALAGNLLSRGRGNRGVRFVGVPDAWIVLVDAFVPDILGAGDFELGEYADARRKRTGGSYDRGVVPAAEAEPKWDETTA